MSIDLGGSTSPQQPPTGAPTGLLLSRDLIFTSKITSTARSMGHQVLVAGNQALAASMIEQWRPRAVFVDLAAGGPLTNNPALAAYRLLAPECTFIAFGSHVDTQALEAATAAGCQVVMPRSKFNHELPNLIRKYLGESPANP